MDIVTADARSDHYGSHAGSQVLDDRRNLPPLCCCVLVGYFVAAEIFPIFDRSIKIENIFAKKLFIWSVVNDIRLNVRYSCGLRDNVFNMR